MSYQYGSYQSGAVFKCDVYLEVGNYKYYFLTIDETYPIKYPQIDFFYLNVVDLSNIVLEKESTKIGNYIIEGLLSLGSVGTGISGFIFRNKQKIIKNMLSKTV